MIVELFGAPCAGKSTLGRALCRALQLRGQDAAIVSSARASEAGSVPGDAAARAGTAGDRSGAALGAVNRALLDLLPPRTRLWRWRLQRYLEGLSATWSAGSAAPGIVVLDQGYMQALCSLVSLARLPAPGPIAQALALLPRPALRIYVEVPCGVLIARHAERARGLTLRERLLELDIATSLAQATICAGLWDALEGRDALRCINQFDLGLESSPGSGLAPLLDAIAAASPVGPGGGWRRAPAREEPAGAVTAAVPG